MYEGKIQRCNSVTNLRRLWQMIGMWQIDDEEVRMKNFAIEHLGVCYSHFMFDQNQLHTSNLKQTKKYTESIIRRRRCLFCNKNKFFFSRGANCEEHSYTVIGKNIQIPCIGQKKCGALQKYYPLVISTQQSEYARYICMDCYEKKGGHIYQRVGKGVQKDPNCNNKSHHQNDTKEALEAIGNWILSVAVSEKLIWQEKILAALVSVLNIVGQEKTIVQNNKIEVPSLFTVLVIFALVKFNYNSSNKLDSKNLTPKHFFEFGEALANSIILAKNELKTHKKILESPTSIEEYRAIFPLCLVQFYDGLLKTLYETKKKVIDRQRKYRKQQSKPLNYEKITKQTTFFVSIILNIAFKGWKIWLPQTMASLCRKPKLLSYLQGILEIVNITSHTQRHERNLEKIRALLVNPSDRICHEKNIWNLGVIDNIDFKEATFSYGNIFDVTRGNSHATLRMLFQFQLSDELPNIIETGEIIQNQKIFGSRS
ncbi:hypothetical protein RclHR1_06430013 [Rhizophagus clarus]|uniref:Uncharacterized protein n=1 Tax=Rhizophagus clarus TaxID=94130 RepID=A0A2Z6S9Y2_9GLOM|nr:hypothetical protein RclHR1_06430013 [Rhizophagus clarus]